MADTHGLEMMRRAIALAAAHRPHPNPRVGAVVVGSDGAVVGEGAHVRAGQAHAERIAIDVAGAAAQGSTAYVTLEPCAHHGRTPPCVDALIESGVHRVVVGALDPDERVSGRGIERLRSAGIEVVTGVATDEVEALDPGYFHHRRTGLPLVTVKAVLTLDGQIAGADGSSLWISDLEMRQDIARLRSTMDALVVGAGAVLADDPELDIEGHRPEVFVIAGTRPIPGNARIVDAGARVLTPRLGDATATDIAVPDTSGDRLDLRATFARLAGAGCLDVMVEGGPTLISSVVGAGLASRFVLYYGPKLGGGVGLSMFSGFFKRIEDAFEGRITDVAPVGGGIRAVFAPDGTHTDP
jgi:diaminohydroxyphosphoribosylaminopyrimidine deaminase/5-amino-6-(5-phosphoribosylamino)uracil reductase